MTDDVFGTRALRERVLETWRASPARFREDANTEEDHARGYYRDRVLVELAQNASDAAVRAGVPGRVLLRLTRGDAADVRDEAVPDEAPGDLELVVANTGAPLDAAGVASLASMRASAKRDDASGPVVGASVVGRFGVGFAAVRGVADEIGVLSTTGSVRFSVAETAAAIAEPVGGPAAAGAAALAAEAARREGSLPALRLPYPDTTRPPAGYDTAVVLRLRDADAEVLVRGLLDAVDDTLLLALPALVEVLVEDATTGARRRIAGLEDRWRTVTTQGELEPWLLADRPVEERTARHWRVTWALPRAEARPVDLWAPTASTARPGPGALGTAIVHAPTPTDDPLTLPALLVATLPLDPTRRHVVPGPATEAVLDQAALAYARLAGELAAEGLDALELVPAGMPAGTIDAALRERVVAELARTPLLTPAGRTPGGGPGGVDAPEAGPALLEPGRAVLLPRGAGDEVAAALAPWAVGLAVVPAGREQAAVALGAEVRPLADLVDELPAAGDVPPERWWRLYDTLAPAVHDASVREALAALPVPLVDGRTVRGVRGLVLPAGLELRGPDDPPGLDDPAGQDPLEVLGRWGLRVVHPAASHPVLERLGALAADPRALLEHPAVRRAVLDVADDDDLELAERVTTAVLSLVRGALGTGEGPADAGPDRPDRPDRPERPGRSDGADDDADSGLPADVAAWLGLLTLAAADGEPMPAHGLVLPGSVAAQLLDPRVVAPVDADAVQRWGDDVLAAAGVRGDLVVVRVADVTADPDPFELDPEGSSTLVAQGLDGWDEYVAELATVLGPGAEVGELSAVADLDAVGPGAWPQVLERLASRPALRRALLEPVRAVGAAAGGAAADAPSYTAWWLRARAGLGLDGPFATPDADDVLRRLVPPAPEVASDLDVAVLAALGGVRDAAAIAMPEWGALLRGLAPVGSPVEPALAAQVWSAWSARARQDGPSTSGPDVLPALVAVDRVALVHADDAAVADAPMWWQRTDVAALVPAAGGDDAELLGDLLDLPLATELADGRVDADDEVRGAALAETPAAVLALLPAAPATWVEHEVLRVDGVPVDWWVEGEGTAAVVHATHAAGLARGLAQAAGRWSLRYAVEVVAAEPARLGEVLIEQTVDDSP